MPQPLNKWHLIGFITQTRQAKDFLNPTWCLGHFQHKYNKNRHPVSVTLTFLIKTLKAIEARTLERFPDCILGQPMFMGDKVVMRGRKELMTVFCGFDVGHDKRSPRLYHFTMPRTIVVVPRSRRSTSVVVPLIARPMIIVVVHIDYMSAPRLILRRGLVRDCHGYEPSR